MEEEKTNRWMWVVPLVVLVVILTLFASYQWIIPRTDLEVRTVYHEAPGGGGTGGTININILLTNLGNRDVSSLDCHATIYIKGGGVVTRHSIVDEVLTQGENVEIKLVHIGSQYETYRLDIDVSFDSVGNSHLENLEYETREDLMNMVFVENIR